MVLRQKFRTSVLTRVLSSAVVPFTLSLTLSGCTGVIEGVDSPGGSCLSCPGADGSTGTNVNTPGGTLGGTPAGAAGGTPGGDGLGTEPPIGVGDPSTPDGVGFSTRFPKLSNAQWERTVQDLFGLPVPLGLSQDFTQEPKDHPYENVAAASQTVSGDAVTRYQAAAERAALAITTDPAKLARITPRGTFADDRARGAAFIEQFGRRAYRRALRDDERAALSALYAQGPSLASGGAFAAGAQLVIEAVLQSPHFLYRVESSDSDVSSASKVMLSGAEVATRLSYAFWGSMPNDVLLDAAAAGELDSADGVARWAENMLDDPRARDVLTFFHEQTFLVSAYGTQAKDPALGFDAEALAPVLRDEAKRFFQHLYEANGGIAQLLTEPIAFVNEDTARFYGLSGVQGKALVERAMNPGERAGLFTQLGFLTKNATQQTSDPVHRGLMVLRRVLCDEPDPPPAMFSLPKPEAGLTTREVYTKATACGVGCHDTMINPPGFSFEMFDTVGRLRTVEAGKPIDASASLMLRDGFTREEKAQNPTSQLSFQNAIDLMNKLSSTPRVHECYARNLMTYALARDVNPVERGVSKLLGRTSNDLISMRALILELVKLDTFRARVATP